MKHLLTIENRPYLLGTISAGLVISALGFQYIGGLMPCTLCIWQRIPHAIVAALCLGMLGLRAPAHKIFLSAICAIIMLISTALAFYHVGVEIGVWQGLSTCGMIDLSGSVADIEAQLTQPTPDCGTVTWRFLGHSMAGWNLFISAILTGAWIGLTHRFQK